MKPQPQRSRNVSQSTTKYLLDALNHPVASLCMFVLAVPLFVLFGPESGGADVTVEVLSERFEALKDLTFSVLQDMSWHAKACSAASLAAFVVLTTFAYDPVTFVVLQCFGLIDPFYEFAGRCKRETTSLSRYPMCGFQLITDKSLTSAQKAGFYRNIVAKGLSEPQSFKSIAERYSSIDSYCPHATLSVQNKWSNLEFALTVTIGSGLVFSDFPLRPMHFDTPLYSEMFRWSLTPSKCVTLQFRRCLKNACLLALVDHTNAPSRGDMLYTIFSCTEACIRCYTKTALGNVHRKALELAVEEAAGEVLAAMGAADTPRTYSYQNADNPLVTYHIVFHVYVVLHMYFEKFGVSAGIWFWNACCPALDKVFATIEQVNKEMKFTLAPVEGCSGISSMLCFNVPWNENVRKLMPRAEQKILPAPRSRARQPPHRSVTRFPVQCVSGLRAIVGRLFDGVLAFFSQLMFGDFHIDSLTF
jgi:hypothetical protein